MPRFPVPAAGGGQIIPYLKKSIRLLRHGCRNRPFFHIVVMDCDKTSAHIPIEQVGSFDPLANERNERLVAFNFERIRYWMGEGVALSPKVSELLGLCGFLPIHPRTYMTAWRRRGEDQAKKTNPWLANKREEVIMKAHMYREERAAKRAEKQAEEENNPEAESQ